MQKRIRRRRNKRIRAVIFAVVAVAAVVVCAVALFSGGGAPKGSGAPAQTQVAIAAPQYPTASPAPQQDAASLAPAPQQPDATPSAQATASAWVQPCVSRSDYEYVDDARSIHIQRVEEDGCVYYVADVQLRSASQFHTALSDATLSGYEVRLSSMAAGVGAVFAINGDSCGSHDYGTIIREGKLYRANETTRNMLIVDSNADFSVRVDRAGEDPAQLAEQLLAQGVLHTFEFGPELVRDGAAVAFSPDFNIISTRSSRLEPRTAIGQIGPLHYVIIVADGRQDGYSAGMSLQTLQSLFVRYGAHTAMNLDGGGTTEMWLCGEIINRPSGGEREMSDIIWF